MSRRHRAEKRDIIPDPKFGDVVLTKFMNAVMLDGKKSTAERIVYGALDIVAEKAKDDPIKVWDRAMSNVKPKVEVKSRRVGGSTYQVPVDVRFDRSQALGMRWIVQYARQRSEKTMRDRLAAEILDAAQNRGNTVKKREDVHKMADANKAFAHYRW
jgi:small subunit ribosomal protein S7